MFASLQLMLWNLIDFNSNLLSSSFVRNLLEVDVMKLCYPSVWGEGGFAKQAPLAMPCSLLSFLLPPSHHCFLQLSASPDSWALSVSSLWAASNQIQGYCQKIGFPKIFRIGKNRSDFFFFLRVKILSVAAKRGPDFSEEFNMLFNIPKCPQNPWSSLQHWTPGSGHAWFWMSALKHNNSLCCCG